jgi:integrase/recombinase XerD
VTEYVNSILSLTPKRSDSTITYNLKIIKFALESIPNDLDKCSNKDIDAFRLALSTWTRVRKGHKGKPVSDETKKQYIIGFKRFLHWYAEEYECEQYNKLAKKLKAVSNKDPMQSSELLSIEDIDKMIEVADHLRDKAIICTLAESGCRLGEIAGCRIKDFVLLPSGGGKLTFPVSKTKTRTVTLIRAASYIDNWIRTHPKGDMPDEPLWITKDSKSYRQLNENTIYGLVIKLARKAGVTKRIYPHLFRHTRATQLIKLGWSEPKVKKYLGWSEKSNVPGLYIHLGDNDMIDAVYEMYGLVEKKKDERGADIGRCPKCRKINSITNSFCYNCGTPLTDEAIDNSVNIKLLISSLMSDPELLKIFSDKLQEVNTK